MKYKQVFIFAIMPLTVSELVKIANKLQKVEMQLLEDLIAVQSIQKELRKIIVEKKSISVTG
tara:strand:- start:66 stop:251 length:186 start_codon:yes stop_codon:yes gene_type:complete